MSTSVNLDSEAWLEQYLSIDVCWINTAVPMHPSQHVWNAVRLWNSSFFLWFFPYLLCSSYTAFPSPISLIHSLPHVPSSSLHSHFSPFYLFFFLLLIPVLLPGPVLISLHFPASHFFSFIPLPAASYCPVLISRSKQCCYDLTAAISSIVPKYPASFWFFVLIISCCQLP